MITEKLNLQDRYTKAEDKQKARILENFCNEWADEYRKAQEQRTRAFKEYLKRKHEQEQGGKK